MMSNMYGHLGNIAPAVRLGMAPVGQGSFRLPAGMKPYHPMASGAALNVAGAGGSPWVPRIPRFVGQAIAGSAMNRPSAYQDGWWDSGE